MSLFLVANRDLTPSEIAELFNQLDLDESLGTV